MSAHAVRWLFGLVITAVVGVGAEFAHSVHQAGVQEERVNVAAEAIKDLNAKVGPVSSLPNLAEAVKQHTGEIETIKACESKMAVDMAETKTNVQWIRRACERQAEPPSPAKAAP